MTSITNRYHTIHKIQYVYVELFSFFKSGAHRRRKEDAEKGASANEDQGQDVRCWTSHTAACIRLHKVDGCPYSKHKPARWEFVEDPSTAEYRAICGRCFKEKPKFRCLLEGEGAEFSSNEESSEIQEEVNSR